MSEVITVLSNIFTLIFVVGSMLSLGLSLTVQQITEPLRDVGLVVRALLANCVLVPLAAYLIKLIIPMDESLGIGLILLATAAGAPFLPKLVQLAKGDVAFGVGLMVLLMVVTIFYAPLVLPLFLPGVEVDVGAIAQSLILLMLLPLVIGLLTKWRYADTAASWQPHLSQASTYSLMVLIVAARLLQFRLLQGQNGAAVGVQNPF